MRDPLYSALWWMFGAPVLVYFLVISAFPIPRHEYPTVLGLLEVIGFVVFAIRQ